MAKINLKSIFAPFKWFATWASRQVGTTLQNVKEYRSITHKYKLVGIEENKNEEYEAIIQITNTKNFLRIKPEEVLADDILTDSFSQRDVRALTYLGYLGINSPKYKILAKRLCQEDKKFIFAVKEKGKKGVVTKTAEELSMSEIIENLDKKDAHMIGYAAGEEKYQTEGIQKIQLKEARKLENKQEDK